MAALDNYGRDVPKCGDKSEHAVGAPENSCLNPLQLLKEESTLTRRGTVAGGAGGCNLPNLSLDCGNEHAQEKSGGKDAPNRQAEDKGEGRDSGHGLLGKITHTAETTVKAAASGIHKAEDGLSNAVQSAEKGTGKLVHKAEEDVMPVVSAANKQVALFDEGLAKGAVFDPINGATELINHVAHTHISQLRFPNQKDVDNSIAAKIGEYTGITADAIAVSVATGGVADAVGLTGAGALALSCGTGAVMGGVFTPTGDDGKHFWENRLVNAGIGAGGALLNAGGEAVTSAAGKSVSRSFSKYVEFGAGLVVNGMTHVIADETKSLILQGHPKSAREVLLSGLQGMGRRVGKLVS